MTLKTKKKIVLIFFSLVWAVLGLWIIIRNPYPSFEKKPATPSHIGKANDSLLILEYIYSKKVKK